MKRATVALLCSLLLCACTYHVRHVGDDRFLTEPVAWEPGRTTLRDVVAQLGPPDAIRWSVGRLILVYRAHREVMSSLVLSFYMNFFSRGQTREEDGTLLLAFDHADRLLYVGVSEEPRADLAGDLGLH